MCVTGYSNNYSLTRFRGPLSPHRFGKTPTKPPMPSALTGDSDRQAHTPSIAFRHLPPKEGCRKPVLGVCVSDSGLCYVERERDGWGETFHSTGFSTEKGI